MEERGFKIFVPEEEEPDKDSTVFYNKEMLKNRDISEIAAKVFSQNVEKMNICDALSGSGIRGFRYSDLGEVYFNDSNPEAVKSIRKGLKENDLEANVSNQNANVFLSKKRNFFHFIDIDPFGSFTRFLDSTARASNHKSFVGLTATDNAAPTGSYPKVCRRRYASIPLKNSFMHETSVRIYIKTVFENFSRYDKEFDPKICFQERHYARVMGRVTESKQRTNRSLDNIGYLSFCKNCRWRKLERKQECSNCGSSTQLAGPLWTGKIVDQRFTSKILSEIPDEWSESKELLELIHKEAEILTPFYDLHKLASNIGISVPPRDEIIQRIENKGYPISRTHFSETGFRTDAPVEDIKKIIRDQSRK